MKITVGYFALLREERGLESEELEVPAQTARELYLFLKNKHSFSLRMELLRAAVNQEYMPWDCQLKDGDEVVFIPPVAGG